MVTLLTFTGLSIFFKSTNTSLFGLTVRRQDEIKTGLSIRGSTRYLLILKSVVCPNYIFNS
jgi:hypothetical protein